MPTQRLEHEGNYIYIICRHNGLAGVCMADTEYPQRVAFAIITKLLDDFQEQVLACAHARTQTLSQFGIFARCTHAFGS